MESCAHLHHDDSDRAVVRQPDWGSEVARQRDQQVQYRHQVLGVNRCETNDFVAIRLSVHNFHLPSWRQEHNAQSKTVMTHCRRTTWRGSTAEGGSGSGSLCPAPREASASVRPQTAILPSPPVSLRSTFLQVGRNSVRNENCSVSRFTKRGIQFTVLGQLRTVVKARHIRCKKCKNSPISF